MSKMRMPINAGVLYKMYEYAAFAKFIHGSEIAGYGHFSNEDGIYKLAPLAKQTVTGGDVDVFPQAIINDVNYDISDMVVQWHSHVEMAVFFSHQDATNIKNMLGLYPFLISIVVNCKHEYTARMDIRNIAYGKSVFRLPEADIITYELELIPYYTNDEVYFEVEEKLHRPRKKPVRKQPIYIPPATGASVLPAYNPPTLFQEDELNTMWNSGAFDSDRTDNDYLDFVPKNQDIKKADDLGWFEAVALLVGALCMENEDFHVLRIEQTGSFFVDHKPSHTWCTIDQTGVKTNGMKSSWKEFLMKAGGDFNRDYGYTVDNVARCIKKYANPVEQKK